MCNTAYNLFFLFCFSKFWTSFCGNCLYTQFPPVPPCLHPWFQPIPGLISCAEEPGRLGDGDCSLMHVIVFPKLYTTSCQHATRPTSHIRSSDDPQPVVTHVTVVADERPLPQAGHNRMCPTLHFKHGFFHHIRPSIALCVNVCVNV